MSKTLLKDITSYFFYEILSLLVCLEIYHTVGGDKPFIELFEPESEFESTFEQLFLKLQERLIKEFPKDINKLEQFYELLYLSQYKLNLTEHCKTCFEKLSHINNIRKEFINNINLFLTKGYEPPLKISDSYQHMLSIYIFYSLLHLVEIPITMLLKIDLIGAKLSKDISIFYYSLKESGDESYRIKRSQKRLKRKKADKKQPVLDEYYRIDTTGMKPHTVARTIKENLGKWQMDVPSLDTIKRYLREDDLI